MEVYAHMSLEGGRKPEYPEETHADTESDKVSSS